jgi:hypothetical protein
LTLRVPDKKTPTLENPVDLSRINWAARPLNAVLRALFDRIDLDPATFQPMYFPWTLPEWRSTE